MQHFQGHVAVQRCIQGLIHRGETAAATGVDIWKVGQLIVGAQWLVRYLMGKDLAGYAPRRNVPAILPSMGQNVLINLLTPVLLAIGLFIH